MCVITARYWPQIKSWSLCKNRDRNYEPVVNFRKSLRDNVERLLLWDEVTKYSEGVNEYGIGIVTASVLNGKDSNEFSKGEDRRDFYSPDGKKIRDALLCKTVESALKYLIDNKLSGNTFVADHEDCYLLEGICDGDHDEVFTYKVVKLDKGDRVCRTNHGILIPRAGYQRCDDKEQTLNRIGSESRFMLAQHMTDHAKGPMDHLNRLTYHKNENQQLNCCRLDTGRDALRTTGQLMIIPRRRTLYYRPIMCDLNYDFQKLNLSDSKTYFEILSMKPIIGENRPQNK